MTDFNGPSKRYLLVSDFDQTLSFHDSGHVLAEMAGISDFGQRVAGLSDIHLVQQGGELAYLLLHDPEYRKVRQRAPHRSGQAHPPESQHPAPGGTAQQYRRPRIFLLRGFRRAGRNRAIRAGRRGGARSHYRHALPLRSGHRRDRVHRAPARRLRKSRRGGRTARRISASARTASCTWAMARSDLHVMLHVNHIGGLTIAVSENRYIREVARRSILSDDALSVLVPVLEDVLGWNSARIRSFFSNARLRAARVGEGAHRHHHPLRRGRGDRQSIRRGLSATMSEAFVQPNLERVELARSSRLTERRRAFWGVMACFLVHGLVVSTWVSRIASVKSALHLGDGALGLALLGTAIGSVTAIPLCGALVVRRGSRAIARWTAAGFCLSLLVIPLAYDTASLFAALLLLRRHGRGQRRRHERPGCRHRKTARHADHLALPRHVQHRRHRRRGRGSLHRGTRRAVRRPPGLGRRCSFWPSRWPLRRCWPKHAPAPPSRQRRAAPACAMFRSPSSRSAPSASASSSPRARSPIGPASTSSRYWVRAPDSRPWDTPSSPPPWRSSA